MVHIEVRRVLIRADNLQLAKRFAKAARKLATNKFLPERVVSVRLNRSIGLAAGVKGFTAILARKLDRRPRRKGILIRRSTRKRGIIASIGR